MDACGLTVPPSRWRLSLARMANRPAPESRPPRILRIRPTRTGLDQTRTRSVAKVTPKASLYQPTVRGAATAGDLRWRRPPDSP